MSRKKVSYQKDLDLTPQPVAVQLGFDIGVIATYMNHGVSIDDLRNISKKIIEMLELDPSIMDDSMFFFGLGYGHRSNVGLESVVFDTICGHKSGEMKQDSPRE